MRKKTSALKKALDKVDSLPDEMFGNESASFDDLPSVKTKREIRRTSVYINNDDLQYLKQISKKTSVPVAQISGEIISEFISKTKKNKTKSAK